MQYIGGLLISKLLWSPYNITLTILLQYYTNFWYVIWNLLHKTFVGENKMSVSFKQQCMNYHNDTQIAYMSIAHASVEGIYFQYATFELVSSCHVPW